MKYIKILLLSCLFFSSLNANINSKINRNKKILNVKKAKATELQNKLEYIAKIIKSKKKEIDDIEKKIKENNSYLDLQKDEYNKKVKELEELKSKIKSLNESKKVTENEMISLISKEISVEMVLKQDSFEDEKSVVVDQSIKALSNMLSKKFDIIKDSYMKLNNQINTIKSKIKKINSFVKDMQEKKKTLSDMRQKRLKSIKSLEYQKRAYDKRLRRVIDEQNAIKKTLSKLNILKSKISKKPKKKVKITNINGQKVRKFGNSYQKGYVSRYRGPKTIAPLKSFYIKRKFGNYFDPIYKIKIFNESVTLSSKIPNAKVRNVLNGKVIYAKNTPMLDNVVIIENGNGIHTIFAHLSKIAPTIKKGLKIKKGYTIGRVKKDLIFEVTKKNSHVDPLKLIRF